MSDIDFNMHIKTGQHSRKLRPSHNIMEENATLRFTINYPLSRSYNFEETHSDGTGWTQIQFAEAVQRAYNIVYDSEPDPGNIPGMLNRAKSDGPYGIWGHGLADLYLEGASRNDDGSWRIAVGS